MATEVGRSGGGAGGCGEGGGREVGVVSLAEEMVIDGMGMEEATASEEMGVVEEDVVVGNVMMRWRRWRGLTCGGGCRSRRR